MAEETLAAFVIEQHNVVGFFLNVVDHHLRAALTESLDDLACLWTGSSGRRTAESRRRTTSSASCFPRLAVSNEDSWLFGLDDSLLGLSYRGRCSTRLSKRGWGQQQNDNA